MPRNVPVPMRASLEVNSRIRGLEIQAASQQSRMRASSKNVHALAMRCGFGAQEKTLQQHSRGGVQCAYHLHNSPSTRWGGTTVSCATENGTHGRPLWCIRALFSRRLFFAFRDGNLSTRLFCKRAKPANCSPASKLRKPQFTPGL